MRGIVYKDICLFFRSLDLRVCTVAVVPAVVFVVKSGVYAGMLSSFVVDMIVGMMSVLVFEHEEKADWGKYQRTLPVSGGRIVAGKYTAVLLTALGSLAVSVVLNLAVFAAYRTFLLPVLGLSALMAFVIPAAWAAVSLPFCYWFDFQVAQYAAVILVFPAFFVVKNFEDGMWNVAELLAAAGGFTALLLAGLLAVAGIFLLSLAASVAGYSRKGGGRRARNRL